jgi:precorrin-2 dehydrogenase/sirohydrochlorin ferrochelatase
MATLRRGELLLAVTTGGAGPALSARLKRELEAQFGPEWAAYVSLLREVREAAYRQRADTAAEALRRLAARDDVREKIAAGKTEAARQEAMSCLSL